VKSDQPALQTIS